MPKGFDHNNVTRGDALTPEHFDRAGAVARIRSEYWDKLPFKCEVSGYNPNEPPKIPLPDNEMKWIPTSQQLPANMRFVWVTIERVGTAPRVREGWYNRDQWRIQSSIGYIPLAHDEKVTAFMDIPSCPMPYLGGNNVQS